MSFYDISRYFKRLTLWMRTPKYSGYGSKYHTKFQPVRFLSMATDLHTGMSYLNTRLVKSGTKYLDLLQTIDENGINVQKSF